LSISASGWSSPGRADTALVAAGNQRRQTPIHWTRRSSFVFTIFAWACCLPVAQAVERFGDAENASELQERAISVTAVQRGLLSLAEAASGEEAFNLYRTYNESMGTWLQVEFLRTSLDLSIAATSAFDEQKFRSDLRDHARFALWELDQSISHLDESIPEVEQAEHLRLIQVLRSLLMHARITVSRLLTAQGETGP
jgi:hypothetical protein